MDSGSWIETPAACERCCCSCWRVKHSCEMDWKAFVADWRAPWFGMDSLAWTVGFVESRADRVLDKFDFSAQE